MEWINRFTTMNTSDIRDIILSIIAFLAKRDKILA